MTCCGLPTLNWEVPRYADWRRTMTPQKNYTFNGFSAHMQIRDEPGGAVLLDLGMIQTANGSYFQIVGDALVLTIKKPDLVALPFGSPVTEPVNLRYDIVVTDQTGLESYLFGGAFTVLETVTQ